MSAFHDFSLPEPRISMIGGLEIGAYRVRFLNVSSFCPGLGEILKTSGGSNVDSMLHLIFIGLFLEGGHFFHNNVHNSLKADQKCKGIKETF